MKKTIPLAIALLFASNLVYADPGSSGTVGGGGTGVICKSDEVSSPVELFDLVESRFDRKKSEPKLGDNSLSVREKIFLGLSRIETVAPVYRQYLPRLQYAASEYLRFAFDPWQANLSWYDHFLQTTLYTDQNILNQLDQLKCQLVTLAIHPAANESYQSLCSLSPAGFNNCLLINESELRRMSKDQRACLYIHEALRVIPEINSEFELRSLTSRLCTNS